MQTESTECFPSRCLPCFSILAVSGQEHGVAQSPSFFQWLEPVERRGGQSTACGFFIQQPHLGVNLTSSLTTGNVL